MSNFCRFVSAFFLAVALLGCGQAYANNLKISGVEAVVFGTSDAVGMIQFNISWENSWKDATNNDAAWVFLKYSTDDGATWSHAKMYGSGTNPTYFSTGSGTSIDIVVPSDKAGCFIQRSSNGAGTLSTSGVRIVWNYGIDGVTAPSIFSKNLKIKLFAIEMVYVPTGNFYLGDGDGADESPWAFHVTDNNYCQITSGSTANITEDAADSIGDISSSPVTVNGTTGLSGNANWPVGYQAFYLMKYEITEGQWTDFFNTLSTAAKTNRDITGPFGKNSDSTIGRNSVSWTSGDATTSYPDRACTIIGWPDIAAFADWAALRPATEFEYEKAARGPSTPVLGEYAWGNASYTTADEFSGAEDGTETIATSGANTNLNSGGFTGGDDANSGPIRVGIFATGSSTRAQSGAGYYGNMELTGNLLECYIAISSSIGRAFEGTHGDGALTSTSGYEGNATNADWPGIDQISARGVTSAGTAPGGLSIRGGSYGSGLFSATISNRELTPLNIADRLGVLGGRLARTA